MMDTPLRTTLGDSRPHATKAHVMRHENGIYAHGKTLGQLIDITAKAWSNVENQLNTQNMLRYELNRDLADVIGWLRECFDEAYCSEFMWHVRVDPQGQLFLNCPRKGHDAHLFHEIARLYNLVGRMVHRFQQEWTGSPDQTLPGAQPPLEPGNWSISGDNYRIAQYAELIASWARNSMGPLNDDRYHHPDRRTWTEIHLRTKRRLANMARLWADEDARMIAEHDRANPKTRKKK